MSPFKPKGEIAQWRIVYRIFQQTETGETARYEELADELQLDPGTDRQRIQAAARRAARQLLREDLRAVETVPEVGYRVVAAVRQIPMAGQQAGRAGKALDRGRALTTHIRLAELSEQERSIVQTMALGFAQVAEWARHIGRRVETHEDRLADIEAELARLREKAED